MIQQKSSFEKIKEEILTYESTYRPVDKEVKVINEVNFVDALRAAFRGGDKKTAFGSSSGNSRFKSKWKNNQSSNTSQLNQSSQKIVKFRIFVSTLFRKSSQKGLSKSDKVSLLQEIRSRNE